MLLLGVIQAQASGAVAAGSFDLLETQVLSSSAASVTFSGLSAYAANYQHLQIRAVVRTANAGTSDEVQMRFNGDSGTNYFRHGLYGDGSSVVSFGSPSQNSIRPIRANGDTAGTSQFGVAVIDILDPFETTKNTTAKTLTGTAGSFNWIQLNSGAWNNTAALTSIVFSSVAASNLLTGSRFSLYGLKAGA